MGAVMALPLDIPTLVTHSAHQWVHRIKTTLEESPKTRRAVVTSAAVITGLFILKRINAK
jgi:hypothetical protein